MCSEPPQCGDERKGSLWDLPVWIPETVTHSFIHPFTQLRLCTKGVENDPSRHTHTHAHTHTHTHTLTFAHASVASKDALCSETHQPFSARVSPSEKWFQGERDGLCKTGPLSFVKSSFEAIFPPNAPEFHSLARAAIIHGILKALLRSVACACLELLSK